MRKYIKNIYIMWGVFSISILIGSCTRREIESLPTNGNVHISMDFCASQQYEPFKSYSGSLIKFLYEK